MCESARPGVTAPVTYGPEIMGQLPAYHLKPRPLANPRNSISTEMWFAPSLQHLPVRIRMALNADTWLDLTVKEVAQTAR